MARGIVLLATLALLSACGSDRSDLKLLDLTLERYASTVRWGSPDELVGFIDPETLKSAPIREFDLERLRQLRVASFRAQPPVMIDTQRARQVAEIDLVNVNTQQARSAADITEWRWDATAERWWLVSGLPTYGTVR